jgi:hypothetical protein
MLSVPPAMFSCGKERLGRLAKRPAAFSRGLSGCLGIERVHAFGEERTIFGRLHAGPRKGHGVGRTKPGLALHALAIRLALPQENPTLRPIFVDAKVQTAAVGMRKGFVSVATARAVNRLISLTNVFVPPNTAALGIP